MSNQPTLLEQNRQLSQEVKRRIDQMAAINAVASAVGGSLNLDQILQTALQVVVDIVGAEASGISLMDEAAGELVLRAQLGWVHDFVVTNPMRIPIGQGMSGQVLSSDDVVVYNQLDGTEDYAVPSFSREHFRSIAMAPMHSRGQIIGILSIMSYEEGRVDEDVVNVLRVIADTVGVSVGNARLYEESVEQKEKLSAILDSSADGIIATDRYGRISLVNPTAEEMLGVNQSDLLNKPLREAPMKQAICDVLFEALSERSDEGFQVALDNERTLTGVASPVYVESQVDHATVEDGWVIVLQDITHLREEEKARAQFIQAAAHDMRNPLMVTASSLSMLRDHLNGQDDAEEIIDLALDGVDRLRGLIDDLLHLEHIQAGYNITLQEINLLDVLAEIAHETETIMQKNELHFTLDVPDYLPDVQADVSWIKRAVHNLLDNAAKFTPTGGGVVLRAFEQRHAIHFEVEDNGPGIPAKAIPRLFERFYRMEEHETITGSGLGLAIVKSVAQAHHGEVFVRSIPGTGSTFGFHIPVNQSAK